MFPPDPQVSALRQEDLQSLNYHTWSDCWQLHYLQRIASPLSSWLRQQSAEHTVTRYFMYRMYDGVMCLSLGPHKEGYIETAIFIFPRQPVFICTSLFLFEAAYSPFLGTKALLFMFFIVPLPLVLHQPAYCVSASSLKSDTALPLRLILEWTITVWNSQGFRES